MKDDTREMIKRMRGKPYIPETNENKEPKKDLTIRDMLKITRTRSLNEQTDSYLQNKITAFDQKAEEDKMRAAFDDLNVVIEFIPLEVYDNLVFWGGTIDGIIKFTYSVTPNEKTSGIKFKFPQDYQPDLSSEDDTAVPTDTEPEENTDQKIIDRVKNYYNGFYKYWRDEILNK